MQPELRNSRQLLALLAPLALLLLVAIAYRDAPENTFHFDDQRNITLHPPILVNDLSFDGVINAASNAKLPTRPLPSATFAIDWWRGNGSARPFQYTNLVIHGAATLAVFWLLLTVLRRLRQPQWATWVGVFVGAAIWACHPIQVQGVTYIVQRMTSMTALFSVLAVVFYIHGRQAGASWRMWLFYLAAIASWVLGLITKENAAIVPFLVLLAEYGVVRHGAALIRYRWDWVLLSVPLVVALAVVIDVGSGSGPVFTNFVGSYGGREFTLVERLLTQPRVIAFHFSQILWPLPDRFSLEHDFALSTSLFNPASTFLALLAALGWCAAGVWCVFQSRWRIVGFFVLWVPATLVIESTIIPLEMVFEHRMYMPSVALAGLVSLGLVIGLARAPRLTTPALAASALVIGLLILSTTTRVPEWRTELSLAQSQVKNAPNSSRVWANLANALSNSGADWMEVGPPMMKALELNPDNILALNLFAIRMVEVGRLDEAEKTLQRLLPYVQRDHSVMNTMGMLRFEQGDYEASVEAFEQAVELNPFEPGFRYNLALALEFSGQCQKARDKWLVYLENEPDPEKKARTMARIEKHFELDGGRCTGSSR